MVGLFYVLRGRRRGCRGRSYILKLDLSFGPGRIGAPVLSVLRGRPEPGHIELVDQVGRRSKFDGFMMMIAGAASASTANALLSRDRRCIEYWRCGH